MNGLIRKAKLNSVSLVWMTLLIQNIRENPRILIIPKLISLFWRCDDLWLLSVQTRPWSSTCSVAWCLESCPPVWPTPPTSSRWIWRPLSEIFQVNRLNHWTSQAGVCLWRSRSGCRLRAACSKAAWCPTSSTSTRQKGPGACGE